MYKRQGDEPQFGAAGLAGAVGLAGVEAVAGDDLDVVDGELGHLAVVADHPDRLTGLQRADLVEHGRPGLGVDVPDEQRRSGRAGCRSGGVPADDAGLVERGRVDGALRVQAAGDYRSLDAEARDVDALGSGLAQRAGGGRQIDVGRTADGRHVAGGGRGYALPYIGDLASPQPQTEQQDRPGHAGQQPSGERGTVVRGHRISPSCGSGGRV